MAQVRALVREDMLEELRPGEVLEIGVVDPALSHLVIGQRENVLEQKQPDHDFETPASVAVTVAAAFGGNRTYVLGQDRRISN
jgi:hypothetical protein